MHASPKQGKYQSMGKGKSDGQKKTVQKDRKKICKKKKKKNIRTKTVAFEANNDAFGWKAEEKFAVIKEALKGKPYQRHVVQTYYAIDNSLRAPLDQSIVNLRDHITKVAKLEKYLTEQFPISWLHFWHEIEQLRNNQMHTINFTEVKEVAAKCGIIKRETVFASLHLYHDLGNIVYYGKPNTPDSLLNDIIILNPQWLIHIFSEVFTVTNNYSQFESSWEKLSKHGLLEERLIRHLWHEFLDHFEGLLELMQRFDLLCLKTQSDEMPADVVRSSVEGNRLFYVPSLLKKQDDKTVCRNQPMASKSMVILYIDFDGFLPEGIFYRLIVRLVQWSQNRGGYEPRLFYQQAKLFVDENHEMILRILPEKRSCIELTIKIIKLAIFGSDTDSDEEDEEDDVKLDPATCKMVLKLLDENLQYLGHTWMKRICYGFYVLCKVCKNTACIKLEKCLTAKKCVTCNETHERMHIKQIKDLFGECRSNTEPLLLSRAEPEESQKMKRKQSEEERKQHKKHKVSGITIEDFNSLLLVVSDYWKAHGNLYMLKVLLRQFKSKVGVAEIEEKDDVRSLFQLLKGSGDCSNEHLSVIFDAVRICGLDGVYRKIKQIKSFENFSFQESISTFSVHRQKLIKFGKNLGMESIKKIGFLYEVHEVNVDNVDLWHLIWKLEDKGIIKEDDERSMNAFVESLRKNGLNGDADILEEPL